MINYAMELNGIIILMTRTSCVNVANVVIRLINHFVDTNH